MYHNFFTHSSVEGHLSCSQYLDIINKAMYEHSSTSVIVVGWSVFWIYAQELVQLNLEVNNFQFLEKSPY